MTARTAWLLFRALRWALWVAVVGYYLLFSLTREAHHNAFGHVLPTTEFWMFTLPLAAMSAGLFELMMRDRAGLPRPALGRDWF